MAKFSDLVNQFLNSSAKGRYLSIAAVLIFSAIGFGSLIFWNSRPEYQVLFSNLAPEDAGEMANKLKEKKIPFQVSSNGSTLSVPKEQVYDLRLSLAAEGLPKGGGVGFEVFDRTNLGTTDFVQKLNYQRAMQGELSRTIKQIKEIEQARVHIVTPKESLFVEEQKKPTASVFIKTRSGMSLGNSQVEGIVHLVASSVEGLEPGNITVVDTSGKVLSKRSDSNPIGQMSTTQIEYQRHMEESLSKKAQGMLEEVLGPNKAIARVSMDIDFQQVDITEERFDPNTALRSEQKNVERSSSGTGGPSAGPAGKENPPDAKSSGGKSASAPESAPKPPSAASSPSRASLSERQNEIRNFEVSRINKRIKTPMGKVVKVSAAVIVDGNYKEAVDAKGKKEKQYVPRSQDEMKSLDNLVKKAIGYDEERGDQVEVINLPFYGSFSEEESKPVKGSPWWKEYLMMGYKPLASVILALMFIFFVIRPLLKRKAFTPAQEIPLLQPVPSAAAPAELPQQTAKGPSALDLREHTAQLVREDPSKAAGIIKTWIREREPRSS